MQIGERKNIFYTNSQQRSLYAACKLSVTGAEYVLPSLLRVEGGLDQDAFGNAYAYLTDRHFLLKTNPVMDEFGIIRLVPNGSTAISFVDWTGSE